MKSIKPMEINGRINAPPSKSMMGRAVASAVLVEGIIAIVRPSFGDDGLAAMGMAETLGADLNKSTKQVMVSSAGILRTMPEGNVLQCEESGLCIRMFTPILALRKNEMVLDASGSLRKRPMRMLESISQIGAVILTDAGFPPIRIHGPLKGGMIRIDGSESSQFLTGLLMALPLCREDSVIEVSNLKSKPYIEMTIKLLKDFGIAIVNEDFQTFRLPGGQKYSPGLAYAVEGDWAGASFQLVAGAVAGKVTVDNLRMDSLQADKAIIDALRSAGAKIAVSSFGSSVSAEKKELNAFEFDATDCPDIFPPLVALAANCKGTTVLHGANRLKGKESDRASALAQEFAKLGINVKVEGDVMKIEGGKIKGGETDSHNDHRIAMAAAIAALNANEEVKIKNSECVSKSYPAFFDDLERLMK